MRKIVNISGKSEDHKRTKETRNYRPRLSRDCRRNMKNQPEGEDRDIQEYGGTAYARNAARQDAERMALCKTVISQADTDTSRKDGRETTLRGYKNLF